MKAKCKICGYEWTPRTSAPLTCPSCHSRKWNGDEVPHLAIKKTCKCLRCGYSWSPRTANKTPYHCPACMSALWNTPRTRNRKEEFMAKRQKKPKKSPYPYRQPPTPQKRPTRTASVSESL